MANELPQITKDFIAYHEEQGKKGVVTYVVDGIKLKVRPGVFIPDSGFSDSTHGIYDFLGDVKGKAGIDVGTGCGIQAIQAYRAGAKHVDAIDKFLAPVGCAQDNVTAHGLDDVITVFQSDLFSNVTGFYDFFIANLPIMNRETDQDKYLSLFDPGFSTHERFFREVKNYMRDENSPVVMTHANLDGPDAFTQLETIVQDYGFKFTYNLVINKNTPKQYEWRNYNIKPR